MAKAIKSTEDKIVTTLVVEDVVVLTLTVKEAKFLKFITGVMLGDSQNSLRKYGDDIWEALRAAGIGMIEDSAHKFITVGQVPYINFKNDTIELF